MKKLNELYYYVGLDYFYVYKLNEDKNNYYDTTILIACNNENIKFNVNWHVSEDNIHITDAVLLKDINVKNKKNILDCLFKGKYEFKNW